MKLTSLPWPCGEGHENVDAEVVQSFPVCTLLHVWQVQERRTRPDSFRPTTSNPSHLPKKCPPASPGAVRRQIDWLGGQPVPEPEAL